MEITDRINFHKDVLTKIQSYSEKNQEKEFKELGKKSPGSERSIFKSLQYDDFDKGQQDKYYIDECINNDEDLKRLIEMLCIIIKSINKKISDYEKFEYIEKIGSCLVAKEKVTKILNYLLYKEI